LLAYKRFLSLGIYPSDIVLLVLDHELGLDVARTFENHGIPVNHLFSKSRNNERKHAFKMDDPRVKASTIHSFKGWELSTVILIITDLVEAMSNADYLTYTGMSRSQQNLCVLNSSKRYRGFGDDWERIDSLGK
jgi:superfamily I DNA/RNA helicase